MQTSVERLEDEAVKLTITLPAEEVDREIAESYTRYSKRAKIPGFRPGHAPRTMLDRFVGREVIFADAQERLLNSAYPLAVEEEGLFPIGQPDVGELDMPTEGEDYSFDATIQVRPRYELRDVSDLQVEAAPGEPAEAEVDAQIDYLRDRFASLEPVEDRGVEGNDFVQLSFEGHLDGEDYEGNKVDKLLYEMGRVQMPIDFERGLLGTKPGDEVHIEFEIQPGQGNEEYVGKTASFDVTVHEIKRKVLPEADDEFATQAAGFDGMDDMREDIRTQLRETKEAARVHEIEREAKKALAERLKGEPPVGMVDDYRDQMVRDFFERLEQQGISMEQYVQATGVSPQQIETDIGEEARARAKQDLALEALFAEKELEVTEDDLKEHVDRIAQASGRTGNEEMFSALRKAGVMVDIRLEAVRRKAMRWLMDNVEVVDKPAETDGETEGKKKAAPKKKAAAKQQKAEAEKAAGTEAEAEGAAEESPIEESPAPKEGE